MCERQRENNQLSDREDCETLREKETKPNTMMCVCVCRWAYLAGLGALAFVAITLGNSSKGISGTPEQVCKHIFPSTCHTIHCSSSKGNLYT